MSAKLRQVVREGVVGGVIAYAAVAMVLGGVNLAMGRSAFHTAAAMGAVLLHGTDAAGRFIVEPGPVLAYNGVHLLGSIAVGMFAAVQVVETELHRSLWYVSLTVWVAAIMYSITVFGVFGVEVGGVVSWPIVVLGTVVWISAMTLYFWWVHPGLPDRIRDDLESAG